MLAQIYISMTVVHVLQIIGLAVGALLCFGFAYMIFKFAADPRGLLAVGAGLFFLVMAYVYPHMETVKDIHTVQARADLLQDYGGKVIRVNLDDHWAVIKIHGCDGNVKHRVETINGHYYFAYGSAKFDNAGDVSETYHPIDLKSLHSMCN